MFSCRNFLLSLLWPTLCRSFFHFCLSFISLLRPVPPLAAIDFASKLKVALPDRPSGSLIYSSASQTAPHWFTPFFLFLFILLFSSILPPPCAYAAMSFYSSKVYVSAHLALIKGWLHSACWLHLYPSVGLLPTLSHFCQLGSLWRNAYFWCCCCVLCFLYFFSLASSFHCPTHSIISKRYISLQAMQSFLACQDSLTQPNVSHTVCPGANQLLVQVWCILSMLPKFFSLLSLSHPGGHAPIAWLNCWLILL